MDDIFTEDPADGDGVMEEQLSDDKAEEYIEKPEAKQPCQWELIDVRENVWRPSCLPDKLWAIPYGDPIDTMRFCPLCGRRLVVAPPEEVE
jgi:hypothetical protein